MIRPAYAVAPTLCELDDVVVGIFDHIWPFIGVAVFAMFIYGGVMWMMAAGDPQKVQKATGTFIWAFVGAVILAMLMVIMGTFEQIFGLPSGTLRVFDIC